MSLITETLRSIATAAGKKLCLQDASPWQGDGGHDMAVFSYQEDFELLWNAVAQSVERTEPLTVVLVWDSIPKGQTGAVNTSRYLTPIDWAVALGLRFRDTSFPLRVLVFDLGSHLVADAHALRIMPLLTQVFPWFRTYRIDRAPEFVDALLQPDQPSIQEQGAMDHLDLLRQIWAANLSRTSNTDNHHALFNLLGPQLLLQESSRAVDPTVAALRTLMGSVGLLPLGNQEGKGLRDGAPWIKPEDVGQTRLRLILVDDQWRDGWDEVLCKAVGAEYRFSGTGQDGYVPISASKEGAISVVAATSPNWLLQKLEAKCDDQRFCFRVAEDQEEEGIVDREEILFLDLRLFSGHGVGQEEAEHIEKLVVIARRIMASGRPLPWPGFKDEDLTDIESWITAIRTDTGDKGKDARNDPRYHKALTLLPRILALVDLSLPIVIFSSTGRREIVKEFEAYGNIITVFEKPRLQGQEQQDIAAQTGAQFRAAFQQAMEFVEGRRICRILLTTPLPKTQTEYKLPSSPEQPWTIDVYTDETGDEVDGNGLPMSGEPLRVGGLLSIFPPGIDPDVFNSEFFKSFSRYSVDTKSKLRDSAEKLLSWIFDQPAELRPCHLAQFALTGSIAPEDENNGSRDLDRFHVADNLYLNLARNGIEIILYHMARRLLPDSASVVCRIHMATRHIPVSRYTDYCRTLSDRFGVTTVWVGDKAPLWEAARLLEKNFSHLLEPIEEEKKSNLPPPPQKIRYLGFDSIRPLVHDIASHYYLAPFQPRCELARSYVLPSNKNKLPASTSTNPRALHLLADAILSPGKKGGNINKIYNAGFDEIVDHPLQELIHGARLACCGQKVEALAGSGGIAAELCQGKKINDRKAAAILIVSLREAAETLNGSEFHFFLARRKERKDLSEVPLRQGLVVRRSKYGDTIKSDSGEEYVVDSTLCEKFVLGVGDTVKFRGVKDYVAGKRIITGIFDITPHRLWETLQNGQQFTGRVLHVAGKNLCIIDLDGTTGMLKDTTLRKGDTITVRINSYNKEKREIFLERVEQ